MKKFQPIVEGHGEVSSVPILLRRLCEKAQVFDLGIGTPIRQKQSQLLAKDSLGRAVRLATIQEDCGAVVILFEAEDDCPKALAPKLHAWAKKEARNAPCAIVLAHREYEAWFLASLESLRGKRGIRLDAALECEPEGPRGAKEALERCMEAGYSYGETTDQPALTALFDMKLAFRRSRSFRHLVSAFGELVQKMGFPLNDWPPKEWREG